MYVLQVGDTVSGLAEKIYDDSEWPELLPFLFECVQSNQPRQMESALRIFADLAGFIMPVLLPHVSVMRQQLATCMSHPETDVKIAGLSATTCFIRELEEDSDRNKFQDLIPVMLQTMSSILSTEEQDSAEEALEAFIEIAEAHPTFLRRQLDVVVNNMLQARDSDLLHHVTHAYIPRKAHMLSSDWPDVMSSGYQHVCVTLASAMQMSFCCC